jgi:Ca2+-binding EF-hand superfamily protein
LKPLFEDFDITKIGYVTKNQFTRILKQFDFIPKDDHAFNLLLKRYMDKGNLNEVNYYQFIRDVDKYNEDSKAISKTYADSFTGF